MRKNLVLLLLMCMVAVIPLRGNPAMVEEGLTPASALVFGKSSRLSNLVKRTQHYIENILPADQRKDVYKQRDDFRKKTGIDYLNVASLKKNGLDVERTAASAFWKDETGANCFLLLIPVMDEKNAAAKWIQIQKAMATDPAMKDAQPTVTSYRGRSIYRLGNDNFFATKDGYLLVATTERTLTSSLDLGDGEGNTLAADPLFMDYMAKRNGDYDISVFIRRQVLEKFSLDGLMPPHPEMEGPAPGGGDSPVENPDSGSLLRPGFIPVDAQEAQPGGNVSAGQNFVKSLDYVSLAMGYDGGRFRFNIGARFNSSDPMAGNIINIFRNGLVSRAVYIPEADAFSFLSIDPDHLARLADGQGSLNDEVRKALKSIDDQLGIDSRRDFLPYFSGALTLIMGKPAVPDPTQSLVFIMPMADKAKAAQIWEKIRNNLKKKYSQQGRFGDEKVGTARGFWYKDEGGKKVTCACDDRGIYIGADTVLMKKVMAARDLDPASRERYFRGKLNDKSVFLLFIRKNSFLHEMMKMQAMATPQAAGIMGTLGDLVISCERDDLYMSLLIDMEMIKGK